MAIFYGIIIGALIGLGMFAGAYMAFKLKATPQWRPFKMMDNGDDKRVEEEIRKGWSQFNIEEPPPTADAMARRFSKTHSEELRDSAKSE